MSDESQIQIPASFVALFIPDGRVKPTASRDEIANRYEVCEVAVSADEALRVTRRLAELLEWADFHAK